MAGKRNLKLAAWVLAAWLPFSLIAVASAMQLAASALFITQMGGSFFGARLISTLPWWVVWVVMAIILLGVVLLVSWLLRKRPRTGFTLSALACVLLLGAVWLVFVYLPMLNVLKG